MLSHYVEIVLISNDKRNKSSVKEIYRKMHVVIAKSLGRIAVSFPKWNDNSIGNAIRFFGSKEDLLFIYHSNYIKCMQDKKIINCSLILKTPQSNNYIRFYRDRKIEKIGNNYLERVKKRRENNGIKQSNIMEKYKLNNKIVLKKGIHKVYISSSNEKNKYYCLNIVKEIVSSNSINQIKLFSSYGLGQSGSSVPDF